VPERRMRTKPCTILRRVIGTCQSIWRQLVGWEFIMSRMICMRGLVIFLKEHHRFNPEKYFLLIFWLFVLVEMEVDGG